MSFLDTASVASKNTPNISHRTPKKQHSSKNEADVIPFQKFRVSYQKVTVDVDLEQQFLIGETELTISPLDASLKQVKLDCKGIQISSVIVNQRRAEFRYDDFLQNEEYMNDQANPVLDNYQYDPYFDVNSNNLGINQHHMLRAKYYPLFSDQNNTDEPSLAFPECTSELTINIPESIKLRLQTSNMKASPAISKSINNTPQTINTGSVEKTYTPLNIKINYTVKNSKNGVLFHGGKLSNIPKNRWYCYTYNNDIGCSASSWVPCVDNFYEKPAWDINIVIPKSLDDIGYSKLIGTKAAEKELRRLALEQMDEDEAPDIKDGIDDNGKPTEKESEKIRHAEEEEEEEEENELKIELVVAVPDLVSSRELPHSLDVSKKVINFQFFNPVCAHHLGFAVGAFEKTPMLDLKSGSDELTTALPQNGQATATEGNDAAAYDTSSSNKVPTMFYFLPGQKDDVLNSTAFLYRVFDFFSKEFSSFPFNSYTLLFLDDFPAETCSFAGMTIASSRLLYSPDLIEPISYTTEVLTNALSEQYSGINVLPKTLNDLWCTIGIAQFMSMMFLKKLFGINHHKFSIKKRTELLCEIDVAQRPLSNQAFRFPVNSSQDLELIRTKSPLVLFILDKRMTKTDKSFGLYRVIPKIFLQAMSNDLTNGNCLSTSHFQKLCEKIAHSRLEAFFQNWIHNAGVPTFRVIQKFNKKRMFIEMSISQIQRSIFNKKGYTEDEKDFLLGSHIKEASKNYKIMRFIDEANWYLTETDDFDPQHVFVGPVTVRIHETDGSPYEHIMNINNPLSKMDIQYNTKYRRRKKKDGSEEGFEEEEKDKKKKKDKDDEEHKINKFGDILMSTSDIQNWGLREDEPQNAEDLELDAFEWLRFDADSEWICDLSINLSDQMFESQLRQDRDVEAHYQAVRHYATQNNPTIHSAKLLLRTLLDKRYYYGVRVEAARALAKISKIENDHIGMRYLLRAFKYLFCYSNEIKISTYDELDWREYIPKANNFSDFTALYIQKAFVEAFMSIKNKDGDAPIEIKKIVLGLLKYNDNEGNPFDDSFYVCDLIRAVITHVIISNRFIDNVNALAASNENENQKKVVTKIKDENDRFITDAIHELNRCEKMDRWTSSYRNVVTKTVLEQKIRLARAGLTEVTFFNLLPYSQKPYDDSVRIVALEGLLLLGGLRNTEILSYYFMTMTMDESNYIKYELNTRFVSVIGIIGLLGDSIGIDDHEFLPDIGNDSKSKNNGIDLIRIETGGSSVASSRLNNDDLAKKTIKNAVEKLRHNLSFGKGLQKCIWKGIHSCLANINMKRNLFDIATIFFEPRDYFKISINRPMDKKLVVKVKAKVIPNLEANREPQSFDEKVKKPTKEIDSKEDAENKEKLIEAKSSIMSTADFSKNIEKAPETASFVLCIKRESRFKIQLPNIKLKAMKHEKENTVQQRSTSKKTVSTSQKRAPEKNAITSTISNSTAPVETLPLTSSASANVSKKQPKRMDLVKIRKGGNELVIQIRTKSEKFKSILQNRRVTKRIIRNEHHKPLRYVRLNINRKSVELCTDDRFGGLRNVLTCNRIRTDATAEEVQAKEKTLEVTFKINQESWRAHLKKSKEKKDPDANGKLLKEKTTNDADSNAIMATTVTGNNISVKENIKTDHNKSNNAKFIIRPPKSQTIIDSRSDNSPEPVKQSEVALTNKLVDTFSTESEPKVEGSSISPKKEIVSMNTKEDKAEDNQASADGSNDVKRPKIRIKLK